MRRVHEWVGGTATGGPAVRGSSQSVPNSVGGAAACAAPPPPSRTTATRATRVVQRIAHLPVANDDFRWYRSTGAGHRQRQHFLPGPLPGTPASSSLVGSAQASDTDRCTA